jgi:integrase
LIYTFLTSFNIFCGHLKKSSPQLHDIALLSLHCGLRAGEIFSLTWNDVDFEHEVLSIKDTKSGRNRSAIMTPDIKNMLTERKKIQIRENSYFYQIVVKKLWKFQTPSPK